MRFVHILAAALVRSFRAGASAEQSPAPNFWGGWSE